jgi:hypothetical protein
MWQFQWIVSLLPDSWLYWIYLTILSAGATLYLASKLLRWPPFRWIPMVGQYPLVAEILGVVLLAGGIFLFGGLSIDMAWRDRVHQLEAKIAVAEQKSKDTNVKLDNEIKKKNKVIVENRVVYKDRIKEVEKIIDAQCKVAPEAIDIHNAAAKNVKLEPLK